MIRRAGLVQQLIDNIGTKQIKVIVGLRRAGKSVLLFNLFYDYLKDNGYDSKHIITMKLDLDSNEKYCDKVKLREFIVQQIKDEQKYYIFLDEIQLVPGFEALLNGINAQYNVSIFVTGSNSQMLSSDIDTKFRGRSTTIKVYPLSFAEFYSSCGGDKAKAFGEYLTYGGMPGLSALAGNAAKVKYLESLYQTVYRLDIIERYHIKNDAALDELYDVLCSNIGSYTSAIKLENTLKSKKIAVSDDCINKYLNCFTESFLFEKLKRYDLKGKQYFATLQKFYCVDLGLRNARLRFSQDEITHAFENVVCIELLRRGYQVDIGINKNKEVDFVARLGGEQYYIQCAYVLPDQEKIKQEIGSFKSLDDGYKKIVLSSDQYLMTNLGNGYKHMNVIDFLLDEHALEKI